MLPADRFCLSRRPLVLIASRHFWASAMPPFRTQHRGLSGPGSADHRDHCPTRRAIARGNGALCHDPDRDRARQHARAAVHPLQHRLWAELHPAPVRVWPRLLFRAAADDQSAQGRRTAARRAAGHLAGRRRSAKSSATSCADRPAWTSCSSRRCRTGWSSAGCASCPASPTCWCLAARPRSFRPRSISTA